MWKALGVFGVGGRDEKEEQKVSESESEWCSSCDSDSGSSFHSAEAGAEEGDRSHGLAMESDGETSTMFDCTPGFSAPRGDLCVKYYGPEESDSAASTSSRPPRRNARAESHRKRYSRRSVECPSPEISEEPFNLDAVVSRSRELKLDNELLDPANRLQSGLQSSRSSRRAVVPGRLRGGNEFPKTQSDEILFTSSIVDLKDIQLQKLQSLYRLDKDWGYVNSEKREPLFSWPWRTLTEQQVALGKLEFKKFIVVLSTCQGWHMQPENVLSMDQIGILQQIPVEEIEGYLNHEIAVSKGVQNDRVPYIKHSWLKRDQQVSYECHVDRSGCYIIKLVQPKGTSTLLDRRFGEDRIMPVFINEKPDDAAMFAQTGIIVGLRRYRLWTYKNSGKDDFLKTNESKDVDHQRSVRCYYICTESLADVDLDDPNFMYFVNIQAARCKILHINTATAIHRYASRLQLPLSKSLTADIDLRTLDEIKEVDDLLCKTLDENGKPMSHTNGTGEISPEVAMMLPASVFKGKVDNREGYPTLVQIRMFWEGMGIKGTFLVNHKLDKKRIHYRPSMVKVERSRDLRGFQSVNSFEVLTTSREPKEAHLSQDLIVLLSLGKVPAAFFLRLMKTALDNIHNLFTDRNLAINEVKGSTAEYGTRDQTLRMLIASIPLTNFHLQKNLRQISLNKMRNLRRGCIPLPQSRYLMGTCDPTKERILKRHQVAIAMGDGKICGKVLVYKNPGKHYGDVHLFDAVWDERLDPYVGPSKYTIFFPTVGDRPIVDEIANSDLDGDLYWVCNNAELISSFKPNLPWERPTGIVRTPITKSPSHMLPNELEVALFERFLKIRFANGNLPSMPLAATYWLAYMDQYLSHREAVHPPPEMGVVKKKIDELINIFYKALDAEKSGEQVILPNRLRPDAWPHYMKKPHLNNRKYYHSTSILGQLHDMASMDAKDFGHPDGDILDYDPKFEFEGFENYKEKWGTLFKQYNEEMRQNRTDEEKAQPTDQNRERINRVVTKYQEILKGEGKPLHQIWEEASALYYVNYEHACRYVGSQYAPSMFAAFAIGGTYLCDIYSRKEGVDPYVYAASIRLDTLRA